MNPPPPFLETDPPTLGTFARWLGIAAATVTASIAAARAFVAGVRWIMQAGRSFDRWDAAAANIASMQENMVGAEAFDEMSDEVTKIRNSVDAVATAATLTEERKKVWMADVMRRLDATETFRAQFFVAHPDLRPLD